MITLLHLVVIFDIYVILALSLNLVVGYRGLLTMAHAGFYAIGGYAYALLAATADWGFVPSMLAGIAVAVVVSLAVSLPSWRLRGDFFVLGSLAVQALIFSALNNWVNAGQPLGSWQNLTNGPFGIVGIPRPSFFGWEVETPIAFAGMSSVAAAMVALILWRLKNSSWGRLLIALRDDELAACGLGKNTRLASLQAVAISAGMAAVAGALYAAHIRYVDPSMASLDESILILSMVIVGGLGNVRGPLVGAATLVALPEALRLLPIQQSAAANIRLLIYGLLLVLLMHFRPQGLAGNYRLQ